MSFAREYWEEFEKLSLDILKTYISENSEVNYYIKRTPNRKDGGYDGIIVITTNHDPNEIYKLLSESKLRECSKKDLPMSDFSKALVIAVNLSAQKVYIFTNLHYSQETQKRIAKFSRFSSIQVELIDIFEISEKIKELYPELLKSYSSVFLNQLMDSVTQHSEAKKVVSDRSIIPNILPDLTGQARNKMFDDCYKAIADKTGVLIISGIQGCGKSLFINHLIHKLYIKYACPCNKINLEELPTIREFLVKILSVIWNIDVLEIMKFSLQDIEEITDYLSEEELSSHAKALLFDILSIKNTQSDGNNNLKQYYFFEYLYRIYKPLLKRKRHILYFHNLDYSTSASLNILMKFLKKFRDENILFILEIRDDNTLCHDFSIQCQKELPVIDFIELKEFNNIERSTYINGKYSNFFSKAELNTLKQISPRTPLLIDAIVKWFASDTETKYSLHDLNLTRLYNNEKFLQRISFDYVNRIVSNCDKRVQSISAVIGLMDGTLSDSDLLNFCQDADVMKYDLVNTRLFDWDNDCIKVHHMSYLWALKEMHFLSYQGKKQVYEILFENLARFSVSEEYCILKKFQMAIYLENKDFIIENWRQIISNLLQQEDYSIAQSLLENAYNLVEYELQIREKFEMLVTIVQCIIKENNYLDERLCEYLDELETISSKEQIEAEMIQNYAFWKANYYLVSGKYYELVKSTDKFRNTVPRLRYIRALGVKHLFGIDKCLYSLSRGRDHFPSDITLSYSYYDHLLSKRIKMADYAAAENCIHILKKYVEYLSLEERIHLTFNELTVLFYLKKLDNTDQLIKLCGVAYQNNLYVEESRIYNLLGQFFWLNKDTEQAISFFKKSEHLQEQTNHQSYRWISKTNLALINFEYKKTNASLAYAKEVIQGYHKAKPHKFKTILNGHVINSNQLLLDKEIVSILLMLRIIYVADKKEYEKILQLIKSEEPDVPIDSSLGPYLEYTLIPLLKDSSYYVANSFMIKC